MKIRYEQGDLLAGPQRVKCHGANALGVMGAGVALQIKKKWPNVFEIYQLRHQTFGLKLGEIIPVYTTDGFLILNCITQQNTGTHQRQVDYDAVETIFRQINDKVLDWEVSEVAMPRIGAGLAGGDWNIISEIIERTATNYTPVVWDYVPATQ